MEPNQKNPARRSLRSATHATGRDRKCPAFDVAGAPLRAEWRVDEASSVRLSGDPRGPGLVIRTYADKVLKPDETPPAGYRLALRQTVVVLDKDAPETPDDLGRLQGVLIYHVYWGAAPEDPSAVRRLFDRFASFDESDRVLSKGDNR